MPFCIDGGTVSMKTEVLIADDHAIIRDAFRKILADTSDLIVAGEASTGNETLEKVRERAWGLIVLDLSMPGRSGLELIKLIKAERPEQHILVFSMYPEEQYAVRALRVGAGGYLSKDSDSKLLLPVMRKIAAGRLFVSPKVGELLALHAAHLTNEELPHARLTDREFEIFIRIVKGVRPSEIADEFSLSVKTVSSHKVHILEKMGFSSQVDLVRYAIDHGLIERMPE